MEYMLAGILLFGCGLSALIIQHLRRTDDRDRWHRERHRKLKERIDATRHNSDE